jgi:phosphatidylserine/phosphatidylglycerophosphate/cardiolipin synthase-like enzyme
VVDGKVAYLGSANLTVRSMTQDWEMGVVTDDPQFVGEVQRRLLDADRLRSQPARSLWAPWRYLGYGLSLFFGRSCAPLDGEQSTQTRWARLIVPGR